MSTGLLTKLSRAVKWPGKRISHEIREEMVDKTVVAVDTAVRRVDELLPEIGDLLAGEEITIEVRLRLKQKGEV